MYTVVAYRKQPDTRGKVLATDQPQAPVGKELTGRALINLKSKATVTVFERNGKWEFSAEWGPIFRVGDSSVVSEMNAPTTPDDCEKMYQKIKKALSDIKRQCPEHIIVIVHNRKF